MNQVVVLEATYASGQSGTTTNDNSRSYYNYNGADRGAKITITGSIFKHSRFCKGMIVYRPSLYVSSEDFRTIVNQTNLYMTKTLKNDTDSYILVSGSTFTNLNAYTKVNSLSYMDSSIEVNTGGALDAFTVSYFKNKGIVLNVEDFGGRIEFVDSTFDKNMHYIPAIMYTGESKADLVINNFEDSSNEELFFSICYQKKDAYFFGSSQMMTANYDPDLDDFFDKYERLGLIYIARPRDLTLFKGCTFT